MIDPWDPAFAPGHGGQITQTFNPAIGEEGIDVALPPGTALRTPYPGVVIYEEDQGKQNWGKRAFIQFTSGPYAGDTYAVGHETAFAVPVGTQLPAGGVFGYSGGALSDPSSGHSTGPHIEPQLIVGGKYVDPLGWLASLFAGGGSPVNPNLPPDVKLTNLHLPGGATVPFPGPDLYLPGSLPFGANPLDPSGWGKAIGDGLSAPFTAAGHGIANFLSIEKGNLELWASKNIVAIGVGLAVVLVLFVL